MIGPRYPVTNPRLKELRKLNLGGRFRNYLVCYIVEPERVKVVRVLHGRRDVRAQMEAEAAPDL